MTKASAAPASARLPVRDAGRLARIVWVLAEHGFGHYVDRLRLKIRTSAPAGVQPSTGISAARRLRAALEELGPTFVKFGQALSVRQDLFAAEVIQELQALQDRVPPFPADEARRIIEAELGRPVAELFAQFDDTPLAAASIAQVHRASLPDGTGVIVKVQRPGIEAMIHSDIELLHFLARQIERHMPASRKYEPVALVDEFADIITHELDFLREGRSAERFRENFSSTPSVYVPEVYWEYSSRRVLTLAHSHGRRLAPDIPVPMEERRKLADTLTHLCLVQVFEHGFFHADPHPGNVFLLPDGRLCFHDFGIVGELSEREREHLRELFLAVVARDPAWLADVYLEMGGAPADVDREAFARDLGAALERYYTSAMRGTSFGAIVGEFVRLAGRHRIRLLRETLLVARLFMILDSVVHALDPEFDMIAAFRRYAPGMAMRGLWPRVDMEADLPHAYRALAGLRRALSDLPAALGGILRRLRGGELTLHLRHEPLTSLEQHIDRASNRLSFSLIIAAVVIGSSLVMAFHAGPHYEGIPLLGLIGYLIAAVLGLAWAIAILRSGRL